MKSVTRQLQSIFWATASLVATASLAAPRPGTAVSFLACPVAKDTGPHSDLCFFARSDGVSYALNNPPDFDEPQLRHLVLVEGRVAKGPLSCGAVPLEGRFSVIREIDASCNEIVPRLAGDPPAENDDVGQPAGPEDPRDSLKPQGLKIPPAPKPVPDAAGIVSLVITYPFDSDRGSGPDMAELKEVAKYALATQARRVAVVGYRAASRLSDGRMLVEGEALAQRRAQKIQGILMALGISGSVMQVSWETKARPGTGRDDWRNRTVEVKVF